MKKILCAVGDTHRSKAAVATAADMAKAFQAGHALLAVRDLVGGAGGNRGAASYFWEDAELKRIIDGVSAVAKKAGLANPRIGSVKSRDVPRAIAVFATAFSDDQRKFAKLGRRGAGTLNTASDSVALSVEDKGRSARAAA